MSNILGTTFNEALDGKRVRTQMQVIRDYMLNHDYVTLFDIERDLHYPTSSISAQLRNLKKIQFGEHILEKRRVSIDNAGTWVYKLRAREIKILDTLF